METVIGVLFFVWVGGGILLYQWWARRREADRKKEEDWQREHQREQDDDEFWKNAKRVPATILSCLQYGRVNLRPVLHMRLRVDDPDGAYEVDVEKGVEVTKAHHFEEGNTVHVYVDPKQRERVVFDV